MPLKAVIACFLMTAFGCQTRADALDALCEAPKTCGTPCQTGNVGARRDAMRHHLDATIEVDSVRRIYQEYWVGANWAEMNTLARAAIGEQRGTPDCSYFDWRNSLPAETGDLLE